MTIRKYRAEFVRGGRVEVVRYATDARRGSAAHAEAARRALERKVGAVDASRMRLESAELEGRVGR